MIMWPIYLIGQLSPSGTSSILEEELYTSELRLLENGVANLAEADLGFPDVVFLDESEFFLNGWAIGQSDVASDVFVVAMSAFFFGFYLKVFLL